MNALIFAVLAAATALAYYGYSATSQSSRDRELQLMLDLADEKVLNIESLIEEADRKLMLDVSLEEMSQLEAKVKSSGAAVRSVFVLDEQLKPVPDGQVSSRGGNDAVGFRDWFLANIVPLLNDKERPAPLSKAPLSIVWSCYRSGERMCGRCASCARLRAALESLPAADAGSPFWRRNE